LGPIFTLSLYRPPVFHPRFYTPAPTLSPSLLLEKVMDLAFVLGAAALWGAMVLLVWGFKKLEKPEGGRS
jgi:hypothetical protein